MNANSTHPKYSNDPLAPTLASHEPRSADECSKQVLAAAAMTYAPATDIPRERALQRSAITSLVVDYGRGWFTVEQALQSIQHQGHLSELRDGLARRVLNSLQRDKALCAGEDDDGRLRVAEHLYRKIQQGQSDLDNLFVEVVAELFPDAASDEREQLRSDLFRCLAVLMAEHGRYYANHVAGSTTGSAPIGAEQLRKICDATAKDSPERIAAAITQLYTRSNSVFTRFAFYLTQNYYYLRLLGIDGGLHYLANERFKDSEVFLDTNVLFALFFPASRHHRSVLEFVDVALNLGISFHVTEETLAEFKRVATHQHDLAKRFESIPEELVQEVREETFREYRSRKSQEPELTVDEFFSEYQEPRRILRDEWGVTVLDEDIEKDRDPAELSVLKEKLQKASLKTRGWKKTENALRHDVHLLLLVRTECRELCANAASILTLDTSLIDASRLLTAEGAYPLCVSLDGFLQTISPYVRADKESDFAKHFVQVIGRNLFPHHEVLKLEDFMMFSALDISVEELPPAQASSMIRTVKRSLGGSISDAERKQLAYAVQKAMNTHHRRNRDEVARHRLKISNEREKQRQNEAQANHRHKQMQHEMGEMEARHKAELEHGQRVITELKNRQQQMASDLEQAKDVEEHLRLSNERLLVDKEGLVAQQAAMEVRHSELQAQQDATAQRVELLLRMTKALLLALAIVMAAGVLMLV